MQYILNKTHLKLPKNKNHEKNTDRTHRSFDVFVY